MIRSLSAKDGRLIAILFVSLAWPGSSAHTSVCVYVSVGVHTLLYVPVWREVGPQVGGRPQGQGVGCTRFLCEF